MTSKDMLVGSVTSEWDLLKHQGSDHYKTGGVEPIDLYQAVGAFKPFALCSIIKYAFRSLKKWSPEEPLDNKDLDKIIDYAMKLKAANHE